MGMITLKATGDFSKTKTWLFKNYRRDFKHKIEYYAKLGVDALSSATPVDTGNTAASWGYKIDYKQDSITVTWTNDNINDGVPIAIILQYGHATGWGGYVRGRNYINPAIKPIFEEIADSIWKEVNES